MKARSNHYTHDGNPLARPHLTPTYLASRGKYHLELSAFDSHTSPHSSWAGQYPWSKDTTLYKQLHVGNSTAFILLTLYIILLFKKDVISFKLCVYVFACGYWT